MIQIAVAPPVRELLEQSVLAEARGRLQKSTYLSLRRISCEYLHGLLTIRGEVPTYYLKQLAQTLLGTLDGVAEVNNLLRVAAPQSRFGQ